MFNQLGSLWGKEGTCGKLESPEDRQVQPLRPDITPTVAAGPCLHFLPLHMDHRYVLLTQSQGSVISKPVITGLGGGLVALFRQCSKAVLASLPEYSPISSTPFYPVHPTLPLSFATRFFSGMRNPVSCLEPLLKTSQSSTQFLMFVPPPLAKVRRGHSSFCVHVTSRTFPARAETPPTRLSVSGAKKWLTCPWT